MEWRLVLTIVRHCILYLSIDISLFTRHQLQSLSGNRKCKMFYTSERKIARVNWVLRYITRAENVFSNICVLLYLFTFIFLQV